MDFLKKWIVVGMLLIPVCVWSQESPDPDPLTADQLSEQDRFEWRTIALGAAVPGPLSIRLIQQAVEGRTSVFVSPTQHWIAFTPQRFRNYPFLHLEMCGTPPSLSLQEKLHFRDFFNAGGTLFLDHCDGKTSYEDWKQWSAAIYPDTRWEPLSSGHVLSFSFYLLEKRIMLDRGRVSIHVLENDGRFMMVMNQNPKFSWKRFRQSQVSRLRNEFSDEMRLRFYINLMMYVLTGNYKSDQLHLPTILLRRK